MSFQGASVKAMRSISRTRHSVGTNNLQNMSTGSQGKFLPLRVTKDIAESIRSMNGLQTKAISQERVVTNDVKYAQDQGEKSSQAGGLLDQIKSMNTKIINQETRIINREKVITNDVEYVQDQG
jgi:hypothetical protein